jgi:trehalose 6-phosphate synthase/phosphatase
MALISPTFVIMDEREIAKLKSAFGAASARLLLFDYDGTLVNYTPVPSTATLPEDVSVLLRRLSSFPFTEIFIISGRSYRDIESLVGHLPVKIIAEHGAMIREKGIWKREVEDDGLWKKSVLPVFNQVTQSCQHSYIEEKIYSLTWHYRAAAPESGYENSRRLIGLLNNILPSLGLKLLDGNKVVEVMKSVVGKGRAVKELVGNEDHDFILAIGDDATDEEMFEYFLAAKNAFTIKVGNGNTHAGYRFTGVSQVVTLLKHLTE